MKNHQSQLGCTFIRSTAGSEQKFKNFNEWKQLANVRKGNNDKNSFVSMEACGISIGNTKKAVNIGFQSIAIKLC